MGRRSAKPVEKPAEDWNEPEAAGENSASADDTTEHTEHTEDDAEDLEDQDQGEGGDAPDEDAAADFAAMSTVNHDDQPEPVEVYRQDDGNGGTEGLALGRVLTAGQRAGLDPVNRAEHVEQARHRADLTNGQTDHEADGALDGVSGTPNTGVTPHVPHTAPGPANDMSGRRAMPDPFRGFDTVARGALEALSKASAEAHARNRGAGHGWVDLRTLNVPKAAMDALVEAGAVDQDTRPGGQFSPETGTVYRIKGHE
jgi:hypothetical protein